MKFSQPRPFWAEHRNSIVMVKQLRLFRQFNLTRYNLASKTLFGFAKSCFSQRGNGSLGMLGIWLAIVKLEDHIRPPRKTKSSMGRRCLVIFNDKQHIIGMEIINRYSKN